MSDDDSLTAVIPVWDAGIVLYIDGMSKETLEQFFEDTMHAGAQPEYVSGQARKFADKHDGTVELWADVEVM